MAKIIDTAGQVLDALIAAAHAKTRKLGRWDIGEPSVDLQELVEQLQSGHVMRQLGMRYTALPPAGLGLV